MTRIIPPFSFRCAKVQQALAENEIDVLLVFSAEHLFYLTGFEGGHSPACVLIPADGNPIWIVAQGETPTEKPDGIDVVGYFDDTLERPCDATRELCGATATTLGQLPLPHQRIAFEGTSIPSGMLPRCERFGMADMTPLLASQRRVKDAWEMEAIRAAVALVDFGQAFAQNVARLGMSEVDLFGTTHAAIQSHAGRPIVLQGDLLSGDRTLLMGGPATAKRLDREDVVLVDLQTYDGHYWADTTRTFALGRVADPLRRLFDTVAEALNRAVWAAGPGVPACDVDRAAREFVASQGYVGHFPHHTGHGCGLRYYEEPLIVPNNAEPLAEGMVLCLEPGVYVPGVGGVRLEQMVRVGSSGSELLSCAPLGLDGGKS